MGLLTKSKISNYNINGAVLYEIAFTYYFTLSFLQTSTYTEYFSHNTFHYLSYIGLGLILFKIFFLDKQTVSRFIFNLAILGLLVLIWRTSQNFDLLPMGVFIIGARDVDFKRIIKLYLIVGITILLFVMLSSSLGLIKNLVYHRGTTSVIRRSFGIVYPTDFAAHVLFIVLSYVYIFSERVSYISYFCFLIIAYLLIKFCDARLSALTLLLTIPIVWIGKRAKDDKIISKFIASFYWTVPTLTAYLTVLLAMFYDDKSSLFKKINSLLSGRLSLGHKAYTEYGFSILGKKVIEHGWGGTRGIAMLKSDPTKYFYIDSSYLRLLVIYGIIAFVLILIIMTVISWRSIQSGQFILASIIAIVSISAIVEQRLIDISYDPFLLAFLSEITYPKIKEEKF